MKLSRLPCCKALPCVCPQPQKPSIGDQWHGEDGDAYRGDRQDCGITHSFESGCPDDDAHLNPFTKGLLVGQTRSHLARLDAHAVLHRSRRVHDHLLARREAAADLGRADVARAQDTGVRLIGFGCARHVFAPFG